LTPAGSMDSENRLLQTAGGTRLEGAIDRVQTQR
jgi:hypothetical protein